MNIFTLITYDADKVIANRNNKSNRNLVLSPNTAARFLRESFGRRTEGVPVAESVFYLILIAVRQIRSGTTGMQK